MSSESDTFKSGRLLAYLYRAPDGLFVNLEIVRQGYGHAYTFFPFKHMELFRHYGNRARTAEKGLYGDPKASVASQSEAPAVVVEPRHGGYLSGKGIFLHLIVSKTPSAVAPPH